VGAAYGVRPVDEQLAEVLEQKVDNEASIEQNCPVKGVTSAVVYHFHSLLVRKLTHVRQVTDIDGSMQETISFLSTARNVARLEL